MIGTAFIKLLGTIYIVKISIVCGSVDKCVRLCGGVSIATPQVIRA